MLGESTQEKKREAEILSKFASNKRYNTFVGYYKALYGERLQKLVLDAGFTCPNRDGFKSRGGCTFCDNSAFHPSYSIKAKNIINQLNEGIEFHKIRYRNTRFYLAYFQSFSNTYAPLSYLKRVYEEALSHPDVVGIVIGTRPDCVDDEKLDYIQSVQEGLAIPDWTREKFAKPIVTIEYGIESCYDKTLQRINRGHDFATAQRAIRDTAKRGIDVGAHFILGLPGETRDMLLEQCSLINELPLLSVKFHQLQLVRNTLIEREFENKPNEFLRLSLDEYLDLIVDILERLRPSLYIERVAGEVPPRFVKKSEWGLIRNFQILQMLDKRLESRSTYQGKLVYL